MTVQKIVDILKNANIEYRIGSPIMSDSEYDSLYETLKKLDPTNDFFTSVGFKVEDDTRKSRLPIIMASMTKVKTLEEIKNWIRLKRINPETECVLSPKLDGISLCVDEINQDAFTRGDGVFGQKSNQHYDLISNKTININIGEYSPDVLYTYGEVMMSKSVFVKKYSSEFSNPRNLVGGLLNSKDINPSLKDCTYIKYGVVTTKGTFSKKSEIFTWLNKNQSTKINFEVVKLSSLTEDYLSEKFKEWSDEFETDGVIIEINDLEIQESLGRETSTNNPIWARAYKSPEFEESVQAEVIGITWNISKQGYLKPIVNINPVRIGGVTVSNITGNNARFVQTLEIGVGSIVEIKRSGMVIPIISKVIKKVEFQMPSVENIKWSDSGIELVTIDETDDQKIKQLISFFSILEAKNVSEGIVKQLWESGYTSLNQILNLQISDYEKLPRFGVRKATIVYNAIKSCVTNVELSKLQHATGIFQGLGSKKLILLEHFKTKPTLEQVVQIEGFAETSAKNFIDNYDKFFTFIQGLPITIAQKQGYATVSVDDSLNGQSFVFTGFRNEEAEKIIESKGGKISSGISKNTTYLVVKKLGSGSSKEQKATSLGIKIISADELNNIIKN